MHLPAVEGCSPSLIIVWGLLLGACSVPHGNPTGRSRSHEQQATGYRAMDGTGGVQGWGMWGTGWGVGNVMLMRPFSVPNLNPLASKYWCASHWIDRSDSTLCLSVNRGHASPAILGPHPRKGLNPGFPRNPSLAPLPLLSPVCSIFSAENQPNPWANHLTPWIHSWGILLLEANRWQDHNGQAQCAVLQRS